MQQREEIVSENESELLPASPTPHIVINNHHYNEI